MPTVSVAVVGGDCRYAERDVTQRERENVQKDVRGIAQKCKTIRPPSPDELGEKDDDGNDERQNKAAFELWIRVIHSTSSK
jgi:hypothetical protein